MSTQKPTIRQVRALINELYERCPAACCLHVVVDDGNLDDRSVQFCVGYARERAHLDCEWLASVLLQLTDAERDEATRGSLDSSLL